MSAINKTQIGGSHYKDKAVQPWEAMQAWMTHEEFTGFLRGNVIKYIARCNEKGGIEDLKKARHYLDKLIDVIETETQRINSMSYCDFQNDLIKMLGESSTSVVMAKPHGDYQAEMIVAPALLEGDALKNYVFFVCGLLQLKYPHEEPTFYYAEHNVIENGYWLHGRKLATVIVELGYCK